MGFGFCAIEHWTIEHGRGVISSVELYEHEHGHGCVAIDWGDLRRV